MILSLLQTHRARYVLLVGVQAQHAVEPLAALLGQVARLVISQDTAGDATRAEDRPAAS